MKQIQMIRLGLLITVAFAISILTEMAFAQEQREERATQTGRLEVGSSMGLQAGTADDTVFGLLLNGDYYLDRSLAVGPLMQFGVGDDLFQVGISGQAKYVFNDPKLNGVKPHIQGGLGFITMDVDRPPARADDHDVGLLIPVGGGLDVDLGRNALLGTTMLLNFTNAEVAGQDENVFLSWVFGLRVLF